MNKEMTHRILTAATSYLPDENACNLARLCYRVIKHLNPDTDIIIIDCGSPFDPREVFNGAEVFQFEENVGAITRGGKDGAGRSCCKAIEIATERGYDYVAIHETDFILARSLVPLFEKMVRAGVKVASLGLASPYLFAEWGVLFIDVRYAKEIDYINRYSWETTPPWPLVEMRLEQIFKDDLFFFNVRGMRNEHNTLNVANLANHFPYGPCQWMTHAADMNLYSRMLDLNGVVPV